MFFNPLNTSSHNQQTSKWNQRERLLFRSHRPPTGEGHERVCQTSQWLWTALRCYFWCFFWRDTLGEPWKARMRTFASGNCAVQKLILPWRRLSLEVLLAHIRDWWYCWQRRPQESNSQKRGHAGGFGIWPQRMSFALRTLADGRASLLRLLQNKMGAKTQIPSKSMLGCPPEIWQLLSWP